MSIFPTPPSGSFGFTFRLALDGTFYRFQYKWNLRDTSWYLDIGNDAGEATARNMRMVIGEDILAPHQSQGSDSVPQGVLSVVDTTNQGIEAARDELGARVLVMYEEVATSSFAFEVSGG